MPDPLSTLEVSEENTGALYGFLTWNKVGKMTFKTTTPPKAPNKPAKGTECGIITTTSTHREGMVKLGRILKEVYDSDFGFNTTDILNPQSEVLKNPTKICTVYQLLLRWMDKETIQSKRWFYRSISAYLTNHRGLKSGLGEGATLVRTGIEKPKATKGRKKITKA